MYDYNLAFRLDLHHGLVSDMVADPLTPLFGATTIWYVPVVLRVLLLKTTEPVEKAEARVLPSGLRR